MFKKILKAVLIVFLLLILIINLPVVSVGHKTSDLDYSNWMSETLDNDIRVVDIKMLGAHDAFSSDINFFSAPDKYADSIMKGIPGTLLKGFLVRQSVTQITDANGLLRSGVRYFDIRLTYDEGTWKTKHNFVSSEFQQIANSITKFLKKNDGEILILDFQHINGVDYNSSNDYKLFSAMLLEYGLLEFNYFGGDDLGNITYGQVSEDKGASTVIIIDKFKVKNKKTYEYDLSVRSSWANRDNFRGTIDFLNNEMRTINEVHKYDDQFRVMQAVTTMQLSIPGILDSIRTWSLIERASKFNNALFNDNSFSDLINSMPIVMIDYCNSNDDNFLDNIMSDIIKWNSKE